MSLSALAQGKDAACIPIRQIHNQAKSFSKAQCQSPKAECQMVSHLAINCYFDGPPNPERQLINGRRLTFINSGPYLKGPCDGA